MKIFSFLQIATFLINFSLGVFVVSKNPRKTVNIFYALFSISIALWGLFIFLVTSQNNNTLLWGRLAFLFSLLMPASFLQFSLTFPNNIVKTKKIISYLIWLPTIFMSFLIMTNQILKNVKIENGHIERLAGPMHPLFLFLVITLSTSSLFVLINKYRKSKGTTKTQIAYMLLGLFIFVFFSQSTNLILPFLGIKQFNLLGPLFSIPMVILICIAIIKHRLMDIRVIIQKSLIYTLLLSIIIIFYLGTISVIGYLFQKTTNTAIIITAIITTIMGIFSVPRIEKIFRKATDKIFFKDKYDYGDAIHQLSQVLNKNIEMEELLTKTINSLEDILKVNEVKIILKDGLIFTKKGGLENSQEENIENLYNISRREKIKTIIRTEIPHLISEAMERADEEFINALNRAEKFAEKHNTEAYTLVPLNANIIAIIASGKKLSGDQYSEEDLKLLGTFSNQMAVALAKAKLYEEVKNHSLELEKKVAERTSHIQKIQEEQEKMIIDISHGLQTPLTIIRGELEFLQLQGENKKLKDFEKSIDNISKFIYDLLTLSKLESTKQCLRMENVNLSAIIDDLVDYLPTLVQDKNIEIKYSIEPNILIYGNKNKLEEMINNLVSNSIKYIGQGTYIKISLYRKQNNTIIEIEDDGAGISDTDLPHIFERFYRANSKTKGSGLGLAICKEIAHKHNGKITATSKLGLGSKFTITLDNSTVLKKYKK